MVAGVDDARGSARVRLGLVQVPKSPRPVTERLFVQGERSSSPAQDVTHVLNLSLGHAGDDRAELLEQRGEGARLGAGHPLSSLASSSTL